MKRIFRETAVYAFLVLVGITGWMFPPGVAAEAPSSEQLTVQLTETNSRLRAETLQFIWENPETTQIPYPEIINLLDDESRVAVVDGQTGKERVTTPGKLARDILIRDVQAARSDLSLALLRHRPSVRWRIAKLLGEARDPSTVDMLIGLLREDQDSLVRLTASDSLIALGKLAPPLVVELLNHSDPDVRKQATYIAATMRDPNTLEALLDVALNNDTPDAVHARSAVLRFGQQATEALQIALEGELTPYARKQAMILAGRLGNTSVLEELIFTLYTSEDEQERQAAFLGLSQATDPRITDAALNAISDLNPVIAHVAPRLLRRLGPEASRIIGGYLNNSDRYMQRYALIALQSMGYASWDMLIKIVDDEDQELEIRIAAARVLKHGEYYRVPVATKVTSQTLLGDWGQLALNGNRLRGYYISLLDHPEEYIQAGGLNLLDRLRDPTLIPIFLDRLNDDSPLVSGEAKNAIQTLGRTAYPELKKFLNSETSGRLKKIARILEGDHYIPHTDIERVQFYAALEEWEELDAIGESALAYLLEQLLDPNRDTTLWAAWTLSRFDEGYPIKSYDIEAFDTLLVDILHYSDKVRVDSAYKVLIRSADYRAAAYMLVGLFSKDEDISIRAAEALGRIGSPALPLLRKCLECGIPRLRSRGLKALEELGAESIDTLISHIEDPAIGTDVVKVLTRLDYQPSSAEEKVQFLLARRQYGQLARMGNLGLQPLLEIAGDPRNPNRVLALAALGGSENLDVIPTLIDGMTDRNTAVRKASEKSLTRLGRDAEKQLKEFTVKANITHAQKAAQVLKQINYIPANEMEGIWIDAVLHDWDSLLNQKQLTYDTLKPHLLNPDNNIRALANAALAATREHAIMKHRNIVTTISTNVIASLDSVNAEERAAAADIINRHGQEATFLIPKLIANLEDDNPVLVRGEKKVTILGVLTPGTQAAMALGAMGEPAVEPLLAALPGASPITKRNIILAISGIADKRLRSHLINALNDPRRGVVLRAFVTLTKLDDPELLPMLLSKALEAAPAIQIQLLNQLIQQGEPVSEMIASQMNSLRKNETHMMQVIEMLGVLGDQIAERTLLQLSRSEDVEVRRKALIALGQISRPDAIRGLIEGMGDSSWEIREAAEFALISMGDSCLEVVISALPGEEESMQRNLFQLLSTITNQNLGDDPQAWASWWEEQKSLNRFETGTL